MYLSLCRKQLYYIFNFIAFKMVKSCSAYDCTNRFEKGGIQFHGFPMKDEELCKNGLLLPI